MGDLIHRLCSGRICKKFADLLSGRTRIKWSLEPTDEEAARPSDNHIRGHQQDYIDGRESPSLFPLISNSSMGFDRQISHDATAQKSADYADERGHQAFPQELIELGIREGENDERDPLNDPRPLSFLTAAQPEIITIHRFNGERCSAMTLSAEMVRQLNAVIHYEGQVETIVARIEVLRKEEAGLAQRIQMARNEISQSDTGKSMVDGEQATQKKENPSELRQLMKQLDALEKERLSLEDKLAETDDQLLAPKKPLLQTWRDLLSQVHLLEQETEALIKISPPASNLPEARPTISELMRRIPQPKGYQQYSETENPTPSQIQRQEVREQILAEFHEKERLLHEAQENLETWSDYVQEIYNDWQESRDQGLLEPSQTESLIDVLLLQEAQEATGAIIKAENDLDEVKWRARELGIILADPDQESVFVDCPDDGYRESAEAIMADNVDREWIQKWLDCENDLGTPKCDDWDAMEVDFGESVSVIATGKERKRIDRFKEMCKLVEGNGEGEGEGEGDGEDEMDEEK